MAISGIPICRSGGLARTVATLLHLVSVLALGVCTTTAIGLLLASRRYIRYSVLELAVLHAQPKPNVAQILEDIFTAKLGLALSAFGTIIWGWGKYLGWASFTYLLVWALFAARDFRRDLRKGYLHGLR